MFHHGGNIFHGSTNLIKKEMDTIKRYMSWNGYPNSVITKVFSKLQKVYVRTTDDNKLEGEVVRILCGLYGIKKSRTIPYHPVGNAQAERFNRTLFGLIKSLDEKDRYKWPDMISHLVFVYNSTPHSVTGIAPYTLMFGREPLIPLDQ